MVGARCMRKTGLFPRRTVVPLALRGARLRPVRTAQGARRPNDARRPLVVADGAGVHIEAEGEPAAVRAVVTGAAEYGVQGSGVRQAVADDRAQRQGPAAGPSGRSARRTAPRTPGAPPSRRRPQGRKAARRSRPGRRIPARYGPGGRTGAVDRPRRGRAAGTDADQPQPDGAARSPHRDARPARKPAPIISRRGCRGPVTGRRAEPARPGSPVPGARPWWAPRGRSSRT